MVFGDDASNKEMFEKVGKAISDLTVALKKEYNKLGDKAEELLASKKGKRKENVEKALDIYRGMIGKNPSDDSVKVKIKQLELELKPPKEEKQAAQRKVSFNDMCKSLEGSINKMNTYIAQNSDKPRKQRRVMYAKGICQKLIKKTLVE